MLENIRPVVAAIALPAIAAEADNDHREIVTFAASARHLPGPFFCAGLVATIAAHPKIRVAARSG
jgi:hypothetical protein